MHLWKWRLGVLLILLLLRINANASVEADTLKTAHASRINTQIKLDGYLTESFWNDAQPMGELRQTYPNEGEPASESTLVKFVYDDEALYVGVICYDSEPDKITKQLTRRDRGTNSDQVGFRIDSHHDHQTAYWFIVNVSGVKVDQLVYNTNWVNTSWDAVWDVKTAMGPYGWSAEFKIPYSALRFSKNDEYVWGLDFSREIPRKNEVARWQFLPRTESITVATYGHLDGIKNISPPGRTEIMPYAVSYGVNEPSGITSTTDNFSSNIGVDIKQGISSSFTLDATINPDFGQVESDQAIYSLSTYETFFSEKRPFFIEGMELFDLPYYSQFYSRRIGKAPSGSIDDENHVETIKEPSGTTILGAAKLTGKTDFGTSIGLINAVTDKETAEYYSYNETTDANEKKSATVEPLANYTVARVKQDLYGSSYVGGMYTSANQKEWSDAYTGSIDWHLYNRNQMFSFSGVAIGSNNGPGTGDYSYRMKLQKHHGKIIRGNFNFDYFGPEFNLNRLGYSSAYDQHGFDGWAQLYSNKNISIFRQNTINFNWHYNERLDGTRISNGGNINSYHTLTNNWEFGGGLSFSGAYNNHRETRSSIHEYWHLPASYSYWLKFNSDFSRKFAISLDYYYDNERNGFFHSYDAYAKYRPLSNLELSLDLGYSFIGDGDFWIGNTEDENEYPVFAKLDNSRMNITFRGTYTFNRSLSLQCYAQAYISAGDYNGYADYMNSFVEDSADVYPPDIVDFQKLINSRLMTPLEEGETIDFGRSDFNYKAFNLNLILRWEYMPGSTIYAVWTSNGDIFDDHIGAGDFKFRRDFKDTYRLPKTNTFLVKINYWMNI